MTNPLSFELLRTADWRSKKAQRHPEDWRNAEAVTRLRELADMEGDAELGERYDSLEGYPEIEDFSDAQSAILSDIGFRWDPPHVDDVMRRVIDAVTVTAA